MERVGSTTCDKTLRPAKIGHLKPTNQQIHPFGNINR